jgi:hypothetical protein
MSVRDADILRVAKSGEKDYTFLIGTLRATAMDMLDNPYNRNYLRILAGAYLVLCGACSVYYLWLDLYALQGGEFMSPQWHVQALCFFATVSAGVYFLRPRLGHHGLVAVTLAVFIVGGAQLTQGENAFHLAVLMMLAPPLLRRLSPSAQLRRS